MDAHLRDLRYFAAVAEELNFTRAAERLHLSQPALSKQIRGLETTLRAQLFRRDRRQVELTAAGAALYAAADRLLQDWDNAVAVVADAVAQEAQVLRVGTLTSIGRSLYPAITELFAKRRPGWQVELHSFGWGDPTAGLQARIADAAFVWLPIDAAEIETIVLATERRWVAISARHPLAGREVIAFSEIIGEPIAALPASAGVQRDFWLAADSRAGGSPRVAAEVSSADEKFEIVS
jgi:DNA-binding transcriptional LysR family regulator